MLELILLVPFFFISLFVFVFFDLKQRESKINALESLVQEVKEQAMEEMRYKIIEFYGNEKIKEKKLNTYEDFCEEMAKIEKKRKNNA